MESKFIIVPARVFISVSGLSLFQWCDILSYRHLYNDKIIIKTINRVCNTLGLQTVKIKDFDEHKLDIPFKVKDKKRLCFAKIKYNF